jgi:hypothetical protein
VVVVVVDGTGRVTFSCSVSAPPADGEPHGDVFRVARRRSMTPVNDAGTPGHRRRDAGAVTPGPRRPDRASRFLGCHDRILAKEAAERAETGTGEEEEEEEEEEQEEEAEETRKARGHRCR